MKKTLKLKFPPKDAREPRPDDIPLKLSLGALGDPLSAQLKAQGLKFDKSEVLMMEGRVQAYNRLKLAGLLTEGEQLKVAQRIWMMVAKHVQKHN